MPPDIEQSVRDLEKRVTVLHGILHLAPRAFVIEFAGTPKSGKSTSVEAVRHFFSRHGFSVHVLVERASVCPIPMKGHLYFNTWCAATMLAELLANVDTETDIIIVDRGLFDALVWLTLQRQRGELTAEEAETIERFLLLHRWRTLIDLAVVMNVAPEEAIKRENAARISEKPGSIMNPDVLAAITKSVQEAVAKYRRDFGTIIEHETSGDTVRPSNVQLAHKIIDSFHEFLDPEILVVPKWELTKLPLRDGASFSAETKPGLVECVSKHGKFMRRSLAEGDSDHVQIIPCGVLMHGQDVFIFERRERDPKYALYGKNTIWQGCHVPRQEGQHGEELLKAALLERITRSLFLSRMFPLEYVGYCYEPDTESSSRHFGVIFRVLIDNDHTAADLRKKEFRTARGHGLAGGFTNIETFASDDLTSGMENWSRAILRGTNNLQAIKRDT